MDYNVYLIAAAILIASIAALRTRLVFEIQGMSLLAFGSSRVGILIYSLIFLPGTILHELSHWLVAEILQVPTGKLEIFPDLDSGQSTEQKLGYVMTGKTDPFRSFLIGFAPFFTGVGTLMVLGYFLDRLWGVGAWWQVALVIYGLIVVSNSMIVSRADSRNWPIIAILLVIVVFSFSRLNISLPVSFYTSLTAILLRITQALGLTIGLNLAMIAVSYVVRRILERVTKKRIVIRR